MTADAGPLVARALQCVIIVEAGVLERQALMLVESIRAWPGAWQEVVVRVVSPRANRRPASATLQRLEELGAEYLPLDLRSPCPGYGTSWRMAALAEVEALAGPPVIAMLDSDTLFLAAPDIVLGTGCMAARPVDVKGICSAGPTDPMEPYWQALCDLCDITLEAVPWVHTTVGNARVRASHNGGLVVVGRRHGLFARAFDLLGRCVAADLAPRALVPTAFRIGSGHAEGDAARLFGSAQTTLTMAMVSLGLSQQILPPTYNVPLHILEPVLARFPQVRTQAVHVHYHWLCDAGHAGDNPLLDGRIEVPPAIVAILAGAAADDAPGNKAGAANA